MIADRLLTRLVQFPEFRWLWSRFPFGSVDTLVRYGIWSRPHYAYGVYSAAQLAKRLDLAGISVVEFGVAGGRGLLALERIAGQVAKRFSLAISVYGFDTGGGMPEPVDYRDVQHVWGKGFYEMDQEKLRRELSSAELILGEVGQTLLSFRERPGVFPVGFVAFDLDYYSSTKNALRLFDSNNHLPRVYCYFDDIVFPEIACHNEYIGELCAIREFNLEHTDKKLCQLHLLRHVRANQERWNDQIYVLHDFQHSLYPVNIAPWRDRAPQYPI